MTLRDQTRQALYHFQTVVTEALKQHGTQPHSIFTIGDIVRHAVHHTLDIVAPMAGEGNPLVSFTCTFQLECIFVWSVPVAMSIGEQ